MTVQIITIAPRFRIFFVLLKWVSHTNNCQKYRI